MPSYILLADDATYATRLASLNSLLGYPKAGTPYYTKKLTNGTLRAMEINDDDADNASVEAIFTGSEWLTKTSTFPTGYTRTEPDDEDIVSSVERLVVCHGDSITYGSGSTDRHWYSWPSVLSRALGMIPGKDKLINKGTASHQTSDLISENGDIGALYDAAPSGADKIYVVMIGTNDLAGSTATEIKDDIVTIINNAETKGWTAYVCGITNRTTFTTERNAANAELVTEFGSQLIRTDQLVLDVPDGVHPSNSGHDLIARLVADAIR